MPVHILFFLRHARHFVFNQKRRLDRQILKISTTFFPFIYSRITLTNDAYSKKDGTGAQIQRVLAVASLAERLNVPFQQTPIIDVAVHPLDPFQDPDSYKGFLQKLNYIFELDSSNQNKVFRTQIFIKDIKLFRLLRVSIVSCIKMQDYLIAIENPYAVSDLNVDDYLPVVARLSNIRNLVNEGRNKAEIAIHYRQGVGNYAIYPGQSISREIEIDYFKECIAKHTPSGKTDDLEVHVYTDSPQQIVRYIPPPEQAYLWEGTPGFSNGVMEIQPLLFTPSSLGVKHVALYSGGDPIDAIINMANSSLLITGRSSLSYIAGLLNTEGIVVGAPDFWHPPLSRWIV